MPRDDGAEGPPQPQLSLTAVSIEPNHCAVDRELSLVLDFDLDGQLRGARWSVKLIIDSVSARHVIHLGGTEPEDYTAGPSRMSFETHSIDVSGVEQCTLTNTALLVASLHNSEGDAIVDVNMVVIVTEEGGKIIRHVYSPLE